MNERTRSVVDYGEPVDMTKHIIKVIGVGGGGCNAVKNMYQEGITDVSFAVCNTDSKSLSHSPVPVKVLLGNTGLGVGGVPERGREEAEESIDKIKTLLSDNTKMVFITAGMGGGTGTGAGPVVASVAKEMGMLTIGVVTIPFYFEKEKKIIKALKGVEEMRKNVDALLIVNNERLCDVYSNTRISVKDAFKCADAILGNAVKSISELITIEGDINLDFRDVETTMKGGGGAIMAIGRAGGEHRVEKAFLNALDSPLLYGSDVSKAKRILFNIYTSPDSPLFVDELQEIDAFMDELSPQIEVIWGVSDDDTLGEDAKIAILATGLDDDSGDFADKADTRFDDDAEHYHTLIKKLYSPGNGKADTTKQNPDEIKITVSNYGGTQQTGDSTPTDGGGTATDAQDGGETDNGNPPETPPVKPATQTGNRSQTNTQTLVERLKIIWNKALKCEE
ncbi:MAG TPA: cell division protein FtsZ [Candidatus Prevotella stercoripullorum]|nr:cell division protein FtsZ [Candidatus Prevotella stercoripullorum]